MFEVSDRIKIRREPELASYEKSAIYEIIDAALLCHVGFVQNGQPFVIPTIHARYQDSILLHGSRASRLMRHIEAGQPVCVAITMLDGLVLARSVFNHSMNYRSVVLFGRGKSLSDDSEKLHGLNVISDHLMPGRWADARLPTQKELDQTSVVSITIEEASAKISTGPPEDEAEDYELPFWAGVLPIEQRILDPVDDPKLRSGIPIPEYIRSAVAD
jgi:nitroimidazol reductase NimA-like FMN-containing flavoprotein (pyridoxamine 5'-phosphate oxidase superfamily)